MHTIASVIQLNAIFWHKMCICSWESSHVSDQKVSFRPLLKLGRSERLGLQSFVIVDAK